MEFSDCNGRSLVKKLSCYIICWDGWLLISANEAMTIKDSKLLIIVSINRHCQLMNPAKRGNLQRLHTIFFLWKMTNQIKVFPDVQNLYGDTFVTSAMIGGQRWQMYPQMYRLLPLGRDNGRWQRWPVQDFNCCKTDLYSLKWLYFGNIAKTLNQWTTTLTLYPKQYEGWFIVKLRMPIRMPGRVTWLAHL